MEFRFESRYCRSFGILIFFSHRQVYICISTKVLRDWPVTLCLWSNYWSEKNDGVFLGRVQLPRLYEPVDSLHDSEGGSMMVMLCIFLGVPLRMLYGNAKFSLHQTLAIDVEPPFESNVDLAPASQKACLVGLGPISMQSVTGGWIEVKQRTVFRHLLNSIRPGQYLWMHLGA